jgi:hypothetical protein
MHVQDATSTLYATFANGIQSSLINPTPLATGLRLCEPQPLVSCRIHSLHLYLRKLCASIP